MGADAIYVVFLGHYLMPLAWYVARREKIPVIFDAFLSLYDTEVNDRARVSRLSPRAWILWMTDWFSCRLADVVLLDTEEHKQYFVEHYGVDPQKILVLPVGCRSDLFKPDSLPAVQGPPKAFRVHFHGTYIPLQGVDVILGAARELQERKEDVSFALLGKGQTFDAMRVLAEQWKLQNVEFFHSVPISQLPAFINQADVCLGIFGTTAKADRVIPNKAYEVIACGKPLITGSTTASKRVFKDRDNVLLSPPGDAHALAESILVLKNDAELRERIAQGGLELSRTLCDPEVIVTPLREWLSANLHNKH